MPYILNLPHLKLFIPFHPQSTALIESSSRSSYSSIQLVQFQLTEITYFIVNENVIPLDHLNVNSFEDSM